MQLGLLTAAVRPYMSIRQIENGCFFVRIGYVWCSDDLMT